MYVFKLYWCECNVSKILTPNGCKPNFMYLIIYVKENALRLGIYLCCIVLRTTIRISQFFYNCGKLATLKKRFIIAYNYMQRTYC